MSIGETLADARSEAGLTIAQVSEVTRIRATILVGIERDDFSLCGGNFYARGHIRSVARAVGVDPEPLIARYDDEHGGSPRVARPAEDLDLAPLSVPRPSRLNMSMVLAAVLVLVVVAYGTFRVFSGEPISSQEPGPFARAPQPTAPVSGSPGSPSSPEPTGEPSSGGSSEASGVASIRFEATEPTWVSVTNGSGDQLFAGELSPGGTRHFTSEKLLRVAIGNAAGVSLTINGKKFGYLSGVADVERFEVYPRRVVGL